MTIKDLYEKLEQIVEENGIETLNLLVNDFSQGVLKTISDLTTDNVEAFIQYVKILEEVNSHIEIEEEYEQMNANIDHYHELKLEEEYEQKIMEQQEDEEMIPDQNQIQLAGIVSELEFHDGDWAHFYLKSKAFNANKEIYTMKIYCTINRPLADTLHKNKNKKVLIQGKIRQYCNVEGNINVIDVTNVYFIN